MSTLARYRAGDAIASIVRASVATQLRADGTVAYLGNGQPRDAHYVGGVRTTLTEPAATNLTRRSTQWAASGGDWANAGAITITEAFAASPDNDLTANRLVTTGAANCHSIYTNLAAGTYTMSWWAKNNGGSASSAYSVHNATTGLDITAETVYTITNDWVRYNRTFTLAAGPATVLCYPLRRSTGGMDMLGWGKQVQLGPLVDSYIPTTTVAVTRAAEVIYLDYLSVPQLLTFYVKAFEAGALLNGLSANPAHIGNETGNNEALGTYLGASDTIFVHVAASGDVEANIAGIPTAGQLVEFRLVLNADGSITSGRTLDGGAESTAGPSAAAALSGSWSAQRLYLGQGWAVVRIAVETGVRTMDEMRAIADEGAFGTITKGGLRFAEALL